LEQEKAERRMTARSMGSAYMEWVKTSTAGAKYNLANSGVKSYPLASLPVDFQALQLTGPGAYGYRPLVEALARKCGVASECVATALGTSGANHLAMAVLIEPGDEVLIEHPGYPLLWEAASYHGADVKFFERRAEEKFAIDVDALRKLITAKTKLIVLTNLHNPSCALSDVATLQEIGSLGPRVLVDEVYLDLLYENTPETAFKLGEQFVVTNSLTKVYGLSGPRCGWVLAAPEIVKKIYRLNDLFGVNNPYVTDQISCVALAHLPEIAKWSRDLLAKHRTIANEFLAATPALESEPLTVGTVIFPKVRVPADELCQILRDRYETVITPGHFFGAPDYVRIGIGGETAILTEGLARVHAALAELSL
jgi:aspartate/methionine/tyrosine aminotransferase